MRQNIKSGLIKFFSMQLVLVFIIAAGCYWAFDEKSGYSAVLGGSVCIIPGVIFAIGLFRHRGAQQAKKIMAAFYMGEAFKLVLSGLLFALTFIFFDVNAKIFFATFIAVQILYWIAPWLIAKNN